MPVNARAENSHIRILTVPSRTVVHCATIVGSSWTSGENAMAHAPSRRRVVRSVSESPSVSKQGVSLWSATSRELAIPVLDKSIDADVCVVGAGIAGMTTAYLLAREGKSVGVLDKGQIGSGATAYTSAHLSS